MRLTKKTDTPRATANANRRDAHPDNLMNRSEKPRDISRLYTTRIWL